MPTVFPPRSRPWSAALPLNLATLSFLGFASMAALAAVPKEPIKAAAPAAPAANPPAIKPPAIKLPATKPPTSAPAPKTQTIEAQGVVRDLDGQPIAGAKVTVVTFRRGEEAVSKDAVQADAQGRFQVQVTLTNEVQNSLRNSLKLDEKARALVVIVHAPGYALAQQALVGTVPGQALPPNTVQLARGFEARGRVLDGTGQPVAGAAVRTQLVRHVDWDYESLSGFISLQDLDKDNPLAREFRTTSDAEGNFTLRDLPAGTTSVILDDPRFVAAGAEIKVNPEGGGKRPTLTAQPGVQVRGRVLYPDGKPVVGGRVTLSNVAPERQEDEHPTLAGRSVLTEPDGTYDFGAQEAGMVILTVAAPSGEWAATSLPPLSLKVGTAPIVPSLTLSHGVLLTGSVREAGTKAPVGGVGVYVQQNRVGTRIETDAQGRYQVRVQPGECQFNLSTTPPDFLTGQPYQPPIKVTAQSRLAPNFTLRRGLTLTGTAKDEKGQPATGAVVQAANMGRVAQATVDAGGKWTLRGLNPANNYTNQGQGAVKLQVGSNWTLKGEVIVKAPASGVALTLSRVNLQSVKVKVVTPQGKPVPGAVVRCQFLVEAEEGVSEPEAKIATANSAGEVTLSGLRPDQTLQLTATKKGYVQVQAGKVSRFGALDGKVASTGLLRATNIIMSPLDAQASGRVLDATGQPAAGARVALLSAGSLRALPDSSVLTDAQGHFTLTHLPQGKVTIGAARGRAFGQAVVQTSSESQPNEAAQAANVAELKLAEEAPAAPHDTEAAFLQLEKWVAKGGDGDELAPLAARLAVYDLARAQKAMTGKDGEVNQDFLRLALVRLARENPQRAGDGAALLPRIEDEDTRTNVQLRLATLTVGVDPARARQVYDQVAAATVPTDFSAERAQRYAELATLAGVLKDPDAEGWLQALTLCLNSLTRDERSEQLYTVVQVLSSGDLATARQWIATLPLPLQMRALVGMVGWGAQTNLPVARAMLGDLEAVCKRLTATKTAPPKGEKADRDDDEEGGAEDGAETESSPMAQFNASKLPVILALLATDPRAAQELMATHPTDYAFLESLQAELRGRLARPEDEAALRGELEKARDDWATSAGNLARVAALIRETLPQLSAQTFQSAREQLGAYSDENDDGDKAVALYAYARERFDPAESRLLLENEWQRVTQKLRAQKQANAKGEMDSWDLPTQMRPLIKAMIPLSQARADAMITEAVSLVDNLDYYFSGTRYRLILWLLADEPTRRTLPLEGTIEEDDTEDWF